MNGKTWLVIAFFIGTLYSGWILAVSNRLDSQIMNHTKAEARLSVVETQATEVNKRLDRFENKIDLLLERSKK